MQHASRITLVTALLLSVALVASAQDKKDDMNEAWMAWIARDNLPARAAVGTALTPGTLVEIMVCAAK